MIQPVLQKIIIITLLCWISHESAMIPPAEVLPTLVPELTLIPEEKSLKRTIVLNLMGEYGCDYFERLSGTAPNDLIDLGKQYKKECHDIIKKEIASQLDKVPKNFLHAPCAQAINKIILAAPKEKRIGRICAVIENYYAPHGWPALGLCAAAGYLDAVKSLIERGAKIDERDLLQRTALMKAARNGHIDVIHYLIGQGADLHLQDACKKNALELARANEKIFIVALLKDALKLTDKK